MSEQQKHNNRAFICIAVAAGVLFIIWILLA